MSATTTRQRRAFVTLLTSDSYLAGALTCVNSLLDVEGTASLDFETVCLVTPATVGQASIKALQKTFDAVVGVAEITTESWKELDLLGESTLFACSSCAGTRLIGLFDSRNRSQGLGRVPDQAAPFPPDRIHEGHFPRRRHPRPPPSFSLVRPPPPLLGRAG